MCISFCVWGRLSAASLLRGGGGRQKQDLQDEQDLQDKERLRAGALNLQLLRGVVIEAGFTGFTGFTGLCAFHFAFGVRRRGQGLTRGGFPASERLSENWIEIIDFPRVWLSEEDVPCLKLGSPHVPRIAHPREIGFGDDEGIKLHVLATEAVV